jgi:hypothetical protein
MMEESASVIAAGAGGMSKTVNGGKIERFSDPKGFREYCDPYRRNDSFEK